MEVSSWRQRFTLLRSLLSAFLDDENVLDDTDALGKALDALVSGPANARIERLRFSDHDFVLIGTLASGQFGVVDVVKCRSDRKVYARKTIEKRSAMRNREQCFPQLERDILLLAHKTKTPWAPHLLCAFQTPMVLTVVMQYADGGNLWDVLESSETGKLSEDDMEWWMPQTVSAIDWCHSQGFAHRDIKPHNFVFTPSAQLLLIDFGSAAPLLPANIAGVQLVPKRFCLVPCGTCDYISPEILAAHEAALVALELGEDESDQENEVPAKKPAGEVESGYGKETDWWSLGVMMYELVYGVAPFFANDIRTTYLKIVDHQTNLKFDPSVPISDEFVDFLGRLLTSPERRWGRRGAWEIKTHPLFTVIDWANLQHRVVPPRLHVPHFTYSDGVDLDPDVDLTPPQELGDHVRAEAAEEVTETISSKPYAFSAFFQSSTDGSGSAGADASSPGLSFLRINTPGPPVTSASAGSAFGAFTWGPTIDAFDSQTGTATPKGVGPTPPAFTASITGRPSVSAVFEASQMSRISPFTPAPRPFTLGLKAASDPHPFLHPPGYNPAFTTPLRPGMTTPLRPGGELRTPAPFLRTPATMPRTGNARRTRTVSDREALRQMVNCVGMSARKKVLESGKKPRSSMTAGDKLVLSGDSGGGILRLSVNSTDGRTPRDDKRTALWNRPRSGSGSGRARSGGGSGHQRSGSGSVTIPGKLVLDLPDWDSARRKAGAVNGGDSSRPQSRSSQTHSHVLHHDSDDGTTTEGSATESDQPPSPSPRPGSALSRRSTGYGDTVTGSGLLVPKTPTSAKKMLSFRTPSRSGARSVTPTPGMLAGSGARSGTPTTGMMFGGGRTTAVTLGLTPGGGLRRRVTAPAVLEEATEADVTITITQSQPGGGLFQNQRNDSHAHDDDHTPHNSRSGAMHRPKIRSPESIDDESPPRPPPRPYMDGDDTAADESLVLGPRLEALLAPVSEENTANYYANNLYDPYSVDDADSDGDPYDTYGNIEDPYAARGDFQDSYAGSGDIGEPSHASTVVHDPLLRMQIRHVRLMAELDLLEREIMELKQSTTSLSG